MKIVFLLSHARHARMWRRIRRLAPAFGSAEVLAFERPVATPATHGAFISLGTIANGHYAARLGALGRAFGRLRHAMRDAAVVYCFSLDLLAMAWLASRLAGTRPRLAYEVADIREMLANHGPAPALLRLLERLLIRRSAVVVLTSSHFRHGYFREIQHLEDFPHVVIEHKPELPPATRDAVRPRRRPAPPLTIGYFGIMKSPASLRVLTLLARRAGGRMRVVCRGIFVPPLAPADSIRAVRETPHMDYDGPYKSPDDLAALYGSVDLVWDAYNETANARWQRTTRFSEALFFRRPVIVNPATQDGRLAAEYDLGPAINLEDPEAAVARLLAITPAQYDAWVANFDRVPESLILHGNEYARLTHALRGPEQIARAVGVRECST